jgi:hypothetical protein
LHKEINISLDKKYIDGMVENIVIGTVEKNSAEQILHTCKDCGNCVWADSSAPSEAYYLCMSCMLIRCYKNEIPLSPNCSETLVTNRLIEQGFTHEEIRNSASELEKLMQKVRDDKFHKPKIIGCGLCSRKLFLSPLIPPGFIAHEWDIVVTDTGEPIAVVCHGHSAEQRLEFAKRLSNAQIGKAC